MKKSKLIAFCLTALMLLLGTTQAQEMVVYEIIAEDFLNFRAAPSTDADIVMQVDSGKTVVICGWTMVDDVQWAQVIRTDSLQFDIKPDPLWVASQYLRLVEE